MPNYNTWYNNIGYKKEIELQAWIDNMPSWFELKECIDIDDEIMNLYDVELSEYECNMCHSRRDENV